MSQVIDQNFVLGGTFMCIWKVTLCMWFDIEGFIVGSRVMEMEDTAVHQGLLLHKDSYCTHVCIPLILQELWLEYQEWITITFPITKLM